MTLYTNQFGVTFNLGDHGKDGPYNRYYASHKMFAGKLGDTFKAVLTAHTKRELRDKMDMYNRGK
jgi:hypothetical protein